MHESVFQIATLWYAFLALLLIIHAARAGEPLRQGVALEALSQVLVAALAVISLRRTEAGFLDVALVLAALGFIQSVALSRLLSLRRRP